MKSKSLPFIILFFAVFFLSTSAIFVRIAGAPASITAFYRLLFTTLALVPVLILKEENRKELGNLNFKQLGMGILSGFLLSVHYVLWFESLNYTSVASSTVIVCLQPLFALIGGYFIFKEKYSKLALSGCLIAIFGSVVIGWGDLQISNEALLGDIMALVAAAIIAGYFMVGQHIRKTLSAVPYSIVSFGSGSIFLAIYSLLLDQSFVGYSMKTWGAFLGLAVVATILGQFIFTWLLRWLSASVISMSILGEAVGTCILSYFILSEKISLQQGIGIIIILFGLGIFLSQSNKKK
ncbi:MAG: DMT family transporter [Fusobacterium sp.]|nr:DMT family transporter [Fusobacterium sp.]